MKERHAILAIDPGGTTGVAACHIDLSEATVLDCLRGARGKKSKLVEGDWIQQAIELRETMVRFVTRSIFARVPPENIHIVFEDFVLRRRRQGGATGILDSIWVAAAAVGGFVAHLDSDRAEVHIDEDGSLGMISWQQAGELKSFATPDRQKMWDIWEPGSPHKQDAWGHIAVKVDKLLRRANN